MFIELTAAFSNEDQPDFEGLGIVPKEKDFDDSDWDLLYVHYDYIATMNANNVGNTNIKLITGEIWSVKESPIEIWDKCNQIKKNDNR